MSGTPTPASIEVHPVTPERWPDMERLFGPRGAYAGCWCTWWRIPRSEFSRLSAQERKQRMCDIVEAGDIPGLLAYIDGVPAAWCAIAPREQFPSLDRSRVLKRVDDAPVWSIVCFFIDKPHRRTGLTSHLIRAAVDYAASRGARIVEAYPIDPAGQRVDNVSAYRGMLPAFKRAGFVEVARRTERRPIVRYTIGG